MNCRKLFIVFIVMFDIYNAKWKQFKLSVETILQALLQAVTYEPIKKQDFLFQNFPFARRDYRYVRGKQVQRTI